jgi:hypothetical protein
MPDTGAPWNIPYVDPTDLVRDYPQASEDLADAIADGLDAAGSAGIGSNVVQVVKTDPFTTSSGTFTTVTGMTATITPSSATSKVLVICQLTVGFSGQAQHWKVTRGGTDIYRGDADGSRVQAVFGGYSDGSADLAVSMSIVFLDSPNVATATEYRVEARRGSGGSAILNRTNNNSNNDNSPTGASSITLIEVAV